MSMCRLLSIHWGGTAHVSFDTMMSTASSMAPSGVRSWNQAALPSQDSRIRGAVKPGTRPSWGDFPINSGLLCWRPGGHAAMTSYDAHEPALVFPPMSEPEFAAFKEDIREHGHPEAIVLYEGKILDGLHRYRACLELGRDPRVVRFEGNPRAAAQMVLGRNFHRRHLTTSQRALVPAEMCKLRPRGNTGTSPYLTAAQASPLKGGGEDPGPDAKRLARHGAEAQLGAA